jgi:hypothetical protein
MEGLLWTNTWALNRTLTVHPPFSPLYMCEADAHAWQTAILCVWPGLYIHCMSMHVTSSFSVIYAMGASRTSLLDLP